MIDYKTLHPSVQNVVEETLRANMAVLVDGGTPRLRELMDKACDLFEAYPFADQTIACAAIMGMVWATIEGENTTFETDNKVLLTMRDRRAIFDAVAECIYQEAAAEANHPDCPSPSKKRVM